MCKWCNKGIEIYLTQSKAESQEQKFIPLVLLIVIFLLFRYSRIYELMCNLQDYWHTNVSALHDIEGRVSNDIDIGTQFIKQPHVVRVIDCLQKNLELIERKFKGLQYAESMDAVRSTMKMLRRARRHHQKSIFFRCGITAMLLIHVM